MNTFRENAQCMLQRLFDQCGMKCSEKLIQNLERSIYNYSIDDAAKKQIVKKWENTAFLQLYKDRLRTIYRNLQSNPKIIQDVFSGKVLPQHFVYMTHQEMDPTRWIDKIEKIQKIQENKFTDRTVANTDQFICPKCKSRKCTYFSLQIRSGDESESIFVNCLDCGTHFRKG